MTNFYFNLNQKLHRDEVRAKRSEKEQLSRECLSLASELPLRCLRPDTVSFACRCRVLDNPRYISAAFSTRVWKHVAMIFAVLVMSIGQMWGDTYTDTYTNPKSGPLGEGKGYFTLITLGDGFAFNNSSVNISSNGGTGTFTISTIDGSYIDSINFALNSSHPASAFSSTDGTVTKKSETEYGFKPSTTTKTSVTFSVTGASGKKPRIAPIRVLVKNREYFTKNFSVSSGTVSCVKSNASTDIVMNTTGSVSSNNLQLNSKSLTITSSGHNIKKIYFVGQNQGSITLSANTGTYSSNAWTAGADVNTVTFTSSSNVYIAAISVELESASSDSYAIHIGKNNADYTDESLTNTSGTTWSKTVTLDGGSYYEFKVKKTPSSGSDVWYGNDGRIVATTSPAWDFSTGVGVNCKLYTTVAGSYTFSWDTSTDKLTITYPAGSHSTKRIYMACGSTWCDASPKFFVHSWGVTEYNTQVQQNACGDYYADIIWYNDYFLFSRNSSDATAYDNGSWKNYSQDLTYDSEKLLWTCTGWSDGKGTFSKSVYSPTTYTISYAKGSVPAGGGSISGSKSNESKTCGVDFTLPSSAVFTTTGYTQTGWTTSDGGSQTHTLGGSYTTNAAQAFYPVWTVNNYDLTWNLAGGTTTSAGTGIGSGVSSNTTTSQAFGTALSAPTVTKTGYNFSAWSPSVASTMPAANTTYTATWTAKTTTITIDANTANHGSTTPGTVTATYGSALPSFTAAAGASGYSLTGYFTAATSGTKIINANGTLVASTDYADGSGNWEYETSTLTLYAQYEEEGCEPTVASITFDNNKSAKYNTSWADADVTTSGGASWAKYSIGTDTSHPMTKPAMKLDDDGDSIKLELPAGITSGSITVKACTYSGKTGTILIRKGGATLSSTEVGLEGSTQTYKINSPDGGSWTNPTLKTVTYDISSGGVYSIKRSGNSVYIYAFSATGTIPCCDATPDAPTSPSNGATGSTIQAVSWTDAGNDKWEVYVSTSSSTPAADQTPTASPTSTSYTFEGLAASTTYYWWVRSICDASHKSSWVAGTSFTTSAPAVLTAMECNTLYKVGDMVPSGYTLTSDEQYGAGLSANTYFETLGDPSKTSSAGGAPEMKNISSVTIDGTSFGAAMYLKRAAEISSSLPTSHAVKFIVSESAKLIMYVKRSDRLYLIKEGGSAQSLGSSDSNEKVEKDVTAGTYYIYANNTNTVVYGLNLQCCTTPADPDGLTVGSITGTTATFTITDDETPASYDIYYSTSSTAPTSGTAATTTTTTTSKLVEGLTPNTTYYAWVRAVCDASHKSDWVALTGTTFATLAAYDVDFTLTNVSYSSGDNEGTNAATSGVAFSTVFAASSGYSLPGTITVTIGGSPATLTTDYTWNQGTGTLTILAASVTDDISVTIVGEELEGDGCEDLVNVEAATATTLTVNVGSATVNSPSSQTHNSKAIKLNSSGYIELSPKAGKSFAVGDSLIVVMYNAASSAKTSGYKIHGTDYTASLPSKTNYTMRKKLVADDIVSSKVKLERESDNGSTTYFVSAIIKHCDDLPSCTPPILPSLEDQTVCPGSDIAAWDATATNAATITAASEDITYSWKKKGSDTELATTASFDLGSSATEGQAGTYVVTVTVSKTGYLSKSASAEVDLTVTAAVEEPVITSNKATVYPGNSVTLTATCGTDGVTWNWYLCANADGTGAGSSLGTSSSYTIASAPAAGTYYYKATASTSGTCASSASAVYTLTVSEASGTCNMMTIFDGSTMSSAPASTSGSEATSGAAWTAVGTATEMSGTVSMEYSGKTYTKGWKFVGSASGSSNRYIQIVIPEGYTGDLVMNGFIGSTGRSVFVHTSPTGSLQTGIAYWTPATTNTLYTATTRLSAGTYYICATNAAYLTELSVNVCGTESCTDEKPTATATNNTVCSGTALTITATGYADGATTFQWQKKNGDSWNNISGATSATYTVASAAVADAGTYRVQVTKGCTRNSNEVTIAVPSEPVFGDVPSSVSVMQNQSLSIANVSATNATGYKWYKSTNNTFEEGTDTKLSENQTLVIAEVTEAVGNNAFYLFCVASNSCGTTTAGPIAVNVTEYVEEDCAIRGNENEAEFGFENTSMSSGTYESKNVWYKSGNSAYLTYTAPTGKYFKTAKVTIASSNSSNASYQWSTDGSSWTAVTISGLTTTLTGTEINLAAKGSGRVTHFRIGRNLDGAGESSGTFYLHKACFTYNNACTATTVTVGGTGSESYTIGSGEFTEPTFTLTAAAVAAGGTLTYSSSNEDIASVDDDGTVTFNGDAGVVKITASYAGDGTYCASEGYYTITVSCSAGTPSIAAGGSTNLSGCNGKVTLTASGVTAGGSYQWFRNGEELVDSTEASITVSQTGVYTVEYTKDGCTSPSTNSATVTSETTEPEVERLVPFQYYHVDKTYSDQMKMRHLFAVKNSGTLDGKHFKMYVSRNGDAATDVTSSNALVVWPNGDGHVDTVMVDLNKLSGKYSENDEVVYTCKAIDCSGNVSDVYKNTITMRVIDATPTLALICSGSNEAGGTRETKKLTVGGDFLTGYNVADLCQQTGNTSFDASQEWGLYTKLKENYIVTPVNGYANFYKLNYEPFDILFLTDYPKASKSDAAATVLDDMADLCDYRPLFSFKTHMVAKSPSKWAAKGFTTAPEVPKNSRLRLNIVCYAHPMFEDLKTASATNQILHDADDGSQLVYTMLREAGYEKKDNVKKGIQGFEIDAAENFVTIGLVHYNATAEDSVPDNTHVTWTPGSGDRLLVAAAERQANLEARMILFSLNAGAHSKLNTTGENVVLKCLEYLLTDAEVIAPADCSLTFDNNGGSGDGLWSTATNWAPNRLSYPGRFNSARIAAPVTVDMEHAEALELRIVEGGSVTIPAGKALEVTSTVRRMDGHEISPTENEDIFIGSNSTGNGTLIFNNNTGDSKAMVAMYTTAKADAGLSAAASTWQYIGTPHNDVASATYNYYDSWLYQQNASYDGWTVIPNGGPLQTFRGYCVTHPEANHTFVMNGKLAATTNVDIPISAGKYVVVANSWVAPIDIDSLKDDDFEGITDKSVYFFNTGSDTEGDNTLNGGDRWAPGTYVSVPIHTAPYSGDDHIPSMQGFYVVGGASDGVLHLDYNRHVRNHRRSSILSGRMHAPKRVAEENGEPEVAKLFFRGSRYDDRLIVLEREDFMRGYDSGWDGEAWGGSDLSPMAYVSTEGRWDAVSAIPDFEGTVVGFRAGEDEEYRIDFEYSEENEPLYLLDTENNTYTRVLTGNAYQFTTTDKDYHDRFIFTRKAPQVATGYENLDGGEGAKAKKLLIEDKMFIMVNGLLYDATGKVVK